MLGFCLLAASLAPADGPAFVAHTAAGEPLRGGVRVLAKDWALTLGETAVPAGELISLRRADMPLPAFPSGPHVVLANGDRLAGEVVSIDKDSVRFKARLGPGPAVKELAIPLTTVAVIWFQAPPTDVEVRRLLSERRRRDVVLLNNGDTRSGRVAGMKSPRDPFLLRDGTADTPIEAANVVAVALNTDLARPLRPRGPFGRAVLANGNRLSLASAEGDDQALVGRTVFGAEVQLPWSQVVALDVFQGRAVYLSDLKPSKYEFTPYTGVQWPYGLDRTVVGSPLRLAGSPVDKGIAMHSQSRLTFPLGGAYRRFEAVVGLDEAHGQLGRVQIRVLVDGKPRDIGDADLTAASGPRPVRVDVTGGRELTLVVEFGGGGDVSDHVDWADARLVRSP